MLQSQTVPEKSDIYQGEGEQAEEKSHTHFRVHIEATHRRWVTTADHHRVDGSKDADREKGNRHADEADDSVHSTKSGSAIGIFNSLAE
ncbi:unnamed protein product [marine sediment metagenome]|uniref:Uncharacterized protein n=1 Tax=marine sediment metagenome TaxID=412755 RepID=X0X598_9ZZZZ